MTLSQRIKVLQADGWSVSAIAEEVQVDRKTVRKYVEQTDFSPLPSTLTVCSDGVADQGHMCVRYLCILQGLVTISSRMVTTLQTLGALSNVISGFTSLPGRVFALISEARLPGGPCVDFNNSAVQLSPLSVS